MSNPRFRNQATAPGVPSTIAYVAPGTQPQVTTRGRGFVREHTGERATDQLQENIRKLVLPVVSLPFVRGHLTTGVPFTANVPVKIDHRLQDKAAGYWILNVTGSFARFVRTIGSDTDEQFCVTLTADADCTADVWIFGP